VDNSEELPTAFPHCSPLAHKLHSSTASFWFCFSFHGQEVAKFRHQCRANEDTEIRIAAKVAFNNAMLALQTREDGDLDSSTLDEAHKVFQILALL